MRFRLRSAAAALSLTAAAAPSAQGPLFVPVFAENFPDPFVLPLANGEFLAYSTNDVQNVPMASSRDLVNWRWVRDVAGRKRDAMPKLAPWVKEGFTWAPEVMKVGERYILYYTANHRRQDKQCLGAAVSADAMGPFVDNSAQPLVCQYELGGSIDANPFRDRDGKLYLYWKADGNRIAKPSRLFGAELAADGLTLAGAPRDLGIDDDEAWENKVVEAPTMVRTPDGLAMFYSGGFFGWNGPERLSPYSMGYAMCSGALGPCTEAPANPILRSFNQKNIGCLSGPGHQHIFQANGGTFISFHAWAATKGCRSAERGRQLYIAPFGWENGRPELAPSLRREETKVGERG
ncbi:glycoside hydrolase family 43 protein [uncultured Sphingomonas sp.]|uniref:glycoside hydrolase family 43 protein n=1 Tax=uncultured Sphingomonas sp. TaxID=158754 RepID=UPI0025F051F0|nr:glycoside hydrolase family 43 protein [uncultured Sphingomonas sp.]